MKRILLPVLCAIAVFLSCLFAGGCGKKKEEPAAPAPTTTTTEVTTTTQAPDPHLQNPYTGEMDIDPDATSRPIGVMVGNNWKSRPQYGIEDADLYFEAETEGGITRMMAIYASAERMPDRVGPCRSARTHFVKTAKMLDLLYIHVGGSVTGKAKIAELGVADFDGNAGGSVFWRDQGLINSKGYEYSMMSSGSKALKRMKNEDYRLKTNAAPLFTFGEKDGTGAGKEVTVELSGYQTDIFRYNDKTGLYTKYNFDEGSEEKHVSADGNPIEVKNVLVLYAPKYMENKATCDFNLGAGDGILISNGKSRDVAFSSDGSAFTFTETDGSPMTVNPGKTYICLVGTYERGHTKLA